nr:MAG TPA: hypothetical protein [Caudoviricetes sp.]
MSAQAARLNNGPKVLVGIGTVPGTGDGHVLIKVLTAQFLVGSASFQPLLLVSAHLSLDSRSKGVYKLLSIFLTQVMFLCNFSKRCRRLFRKRAVAHLEGLILLRRSCGFLLCSTGLHLRGSGSGSGHRVLDALRLRLSLRSRRHRVFNPRRGRRRRCRLCRIRRHSGVLCPLCLGFLYRRLCAALVVQIIHELSPQARLTLSHRYPERPV